MTGRFALAAAAVALAATMTVGSAGPAAAQRTRDKVEVPIALRDGATVVLENAEIRTENLGRNVILITIFKAPRPPAEADRKVEDAEALELCREHMGEILAVLPDYNGRTITHMDVKYRWKPEGNAGLFSQGETRGVRVDARRARCGR